MQCFCGYSGTCSRSKRLSWIKPAFVRKASMLVFHLLVVLSIILPGYSPYKVQAASGGQENTRLGQLYSSPLWKHKENRITKNFADEILELSNLELDKTESNNEERDSTVERKGSVLQSGQALFIENVGQFDSRAKFQVQGSEGTIYLAGDAIWATIIKHVDRKRNPVVNDQFSKLPIERPRTGVNLRFKFLGANPNPKIVGFDPVDTTYSYFLGDDSSRWRTSVPVWGGVRYVDIYPDINLELTSQGDHWFWQIIAKDTATISNVRLRVEGADNLIIDGEHILISTSLGEFSLPLIHVIGVPQNDLVRATSHGDQILSPFISQEGDRQPLVQSSEVALNQGMSSINNHELVYSTYLGGGKTMWL